MVPLISLSCKLNEYADYVNEHKPGIYKEKLSKNTVTLFAHTLVQNELCGFAKTFRNIRPVSLRSVSAYCSYYMYFLHCARL
jgi:hypothetical protein